MTNQKNIRTKDEIALVLVAILFFIGIITEKLYWTITASTFLVIWVYLMVEKDE